MVVDLQWTPLVIPFVISALLTLALTLYGIRRMLAQGFDRTTGSFVGIVSMITVWSLARTAEFLVASEVLSRLAIAVLYVGYGGSTMSILFFALAFTDRYRYLTRRVVLAVLVVPAVAVVIAGTNDYYHELFWVGEFVERSGWYGTLLIYDRTFQPLFLAYWVYTAGSVILGLALLLRASFGSPEIYRRQTIAFVIGPAVALLLSSFFVIGRQPIMPNWVDLTPVGFAVMGLCFGYAIFRYGMLDLVPVARNTVIENMRDGYVVLDGDDRIVDRNHAASAVLGGANIGAPIRAVLPAIDPILAGETDQSRFEHEITLESEDGKRFYLVTVTPLLETGRPIGTLLLFSDVTERRAVQKRYRALIEHTSDIIMIVDHEGIISYASPSVETVAGVSAASLEGEPALEYVHPDDRETFEEIFDLLVDRPGEQLRREYRSWDEDGNVIHLEASVWNLLDNPFVEGIVVNARDITERRMHERELEDANEQLREANEQLEQFADVISHDLRNPIDVVRGQLDFARDGREKSLVTMGESLERMEAIIEDVLTLSREGQSIGETTSVRLATVATTAWEHVETDGMDLRIANDGATIVADFDRTLQLFENLFRNARQHAGTDVTVTVGLDESTLFVEDDGPGIPANRREDVLESGHTTHPDGTGLGLSIVTQVAKAHGWEVGVAESSDGGARFEFEAVEAELY